MASAADQLLGALDADAVGYIGRRLAADPDVTRAGIESSLSVLLSALSRNARSVRGARALHRALERDHDGSILDGYAGRVESLDLGDGQAILRHVFGANQGQVESALGARTGLSGSQIGDLLKLLAPLVLGALAKRMQQGRMGPGGLRKEVHRGEQDVQHRSPDLGDIVDDVLGAGRDGQGRPMRGCLPLAAQRR